MKLSRRSFMKANAVA
ncbi:hypothetical protein, partial [Citrobacter sp. wls831]